jgi:dTDP-4-amino-4,6-dideoxygalactose transaminase
MTQKIPFVDLKLQLKSIRKEIDYNLSQVIDNTAFILGPWAKKFEEEFAAYTGVKHCIGCANGTDALILAMRALGIKAGDEVHHRYQLIHRHRRSYFCCRCGPSVC